MYKINYNHLFYFTVIVKEGSLIRASRVLNLSQPALSYQLKQLEDDIGEKLFDRIGRGLKLNEEGKKVYKYANNIFRETEDMLESIKNKGDITKEVRIGAAPWIPKVYIYKVLKPLLFMKNIKVSIDHRNPTELQELINQKKLDIALIDKPVLGKTQSILAKKFFKSNVILIAPFDFPKQRKRFPGYINDYKMITYKSNSYLYNLTEVFLTQNNLTPEIVLSTNDALLITTLVSETKMLALVPETIVEEKLQLDVVKKVKMIKNLSFDVWALIHADNPKDSLIFKLFNKFKKL
jgi:LysR family transcriptional activator of nhaA